MDVFTSENIKLVSAAIGILTTLIFILKLLINSYKTSTLRKFVLDLCNLPSLIQIINNRQNKIFNEIRLQGKINTAIVDILDLAQSLYDSNGLCIKVNRKWVSITGMPESEALGNNWLLAVHPDYKDEISEKWDKMIKLKVPFEEIFVYVNRVTAENIKVKATATDVLNEANEREFILGFSIVID